MLTPGLIVGEKYRLEVPIGEGGMATVWRAMHTTLERPVAVKFLEAVGTQAERMAERFLREARIAATLRHRHVVDIQDFGVTDEGQPFMVMELLEGQSLADRYVDGPSVTDADLIELVSMILGGLAAVHDQGILHRDVKPENIFLVEDADGIYPKLLDFGVSKGFAQGKSITRTGAVIGTPEYMSPEQARGMKEIGPRSDLFAVGVLLYEGFTGDTPFNSENPGDVIIKVATAEPEPLEDLRPDLPEELISIVRRALQKDPTARFTDAREMRDALHEVLSKSDLRAPLALGQRPNFPSSVTGKVRVLSSTVRELSSGELMQPTFPRPAPVPTDQVPTDQVSIDQVSIDQVSIDQVPTDRESTGSIETAKLPQRRVSSPESSPKWVRPAIALAALGLLAALVAVGIASRPSDEGDVAVSGDLSPGQDVAALTDPIEEDAATPLTFAPPPTDGVPAPESELVDVPSPPDPPDDVEPFEARPSNDE